ncbi:MAG: hypothetical protein M0R17_07050 [Candidatus Omnitrophica bacterium]|jgi:hypothetical protein|nr:hypothetical protein [Candidatus Omnitrophota bacterium]
MSKLNLNMLGISQDLQKGILSIEVLNKSYFNKEILPILKDLWECEKAWSMSETNKNDKWCSSQHIKLEKKLTKAVYGFR